MIDNFIKNKSNFVENYYRKLAERKYARNESLNAHDEEINAESDYVQNTPEFESYTPDYDANQNITQNVAEKTEEETNKGGFWGGLGYIFEQLGLGIVRSLEGISDYVVGGAAELFGQNEWAEEQMLNDWLNYEHADEWYNPDGAMQFVGDVASGVGGMLPNIAAAAIPGIGPALSTGMFMTSAAGQSVSDAAKQNDGLSGNEWLYGTGSGLVEGLVEKMSGGTGKLLGKATGKMFGKQIAKSTAGKLAANFVGEGLEEVASDIIDPALRGITGVNSWEDVKRQYGDLPEQLPHTFLVGGTVGSVLGSADRAGRAIQVKGFNNLSAIENASEFKRVEGQNAQAAAKGGKVLDNTALREKLSDNLRKMDSAQRSEFISGNGLENYFNADGGIRSAAENSIVSQGYNAQAYSENIANIDKDKLKYEPTVNDIRPDIAQAVKDVTLLSDGNGQYVITDGLSDGVNGFYDRESGITYLSGKAEAGDVRSYVASHELVHTLEGSRQYERFANTVLKEINSSEALKNKYNFDRYLQNYSAAHDGVAPETLQYIVQTEIVADFAAKEMLTDEAVLRRLVNRDRNIVQRILDWVRDKIKILVSKGGDRSNIAFYKKAERQLAKALDNPTGGVSITAMDNAFKAKETSRKKAVAENALAAETGIRFSQKISEYPYSMQTVISDYIDSVDKKILEMVEVPKSNFERYTFSEISPGAVVKLKELTGIDFTGYKNCINSDSINHIKDRHGKAGMADDSLSNSKDIARLPYILENFDTIELLKNEDGKQIYSNHFANQNNKKMPLVVFKKKINGTYYCVEAVGVNAYKKIWVVSAYINKKGLTHVSDTVNTAPEFTSENAHISRPFDTIIRENTEKSTENSKKVEKNIVEEKNAGEERFSIAQTDDGKRIVVIDTDQNIFDGVEAKDYPKSVRRYMLDKFQGNVYPVGTSSAYVNRNSIKEYTFSANRRVSQDARTKKMRAGTELDNLLEVAQFVKHEADDGRHPDAVRGWDKYKTCFTFDGKTIFEGEISIKLLERGDLFYDITKIKDTSTARAAGTADGSSSASNRDVSADIIRQETEKVNKSNEKSSEVRYSLKPFAEQVDEVINNSHSANLDLYVSETPEVFLNLGFPKMPMLMRNSKISEILQKHDEMTVEIIKQIPDKIKSPLLILKSKTNPNESVVAITDVITAKGELIIPVWVNQDGVYLDVELDKPIIGKSNFVASAYGRNVKGLLEYALQNNGFLYVNDDMKKVSELLTRHGLRLPAPLKIADFNTIIRENTEKSTENSKKVEKSSENKSNEAGDEARYSIVNVNGGRKAVVIKDNILDGVPKKEYAKKIRNVIKKFNNGIPLAGNRLVKVNAITRNEYTQSKNTQLYKGTDNTIYEDKLKASGYLDEIVLASDKYVNEGLKHKRNDNFKQFARGVVFLDIAGNKYSAKVIVGLTSNQDMVMYDVIDFKPTKFTIKELSMKKDAVKANPQKQDTFDTTASLNTIIRENTEKSTENSKKVEKNIVEEKNAGEERFSIAQTDDGKRIVVIDTDQNIFEGVDRAYYGKTVRDYMRAHLRGKTVNDVKFADRSEREYTMSQYTQKLRKQNNYQLFETKMKAATELDNLVATSEYMRHEDAKHVHGYNTDGYNRYRTTFKLDGKMFTGELLVALKGDSGMFYDIVNIKETHSTSGAKTTSVERVFDDTKVLSNTSISENTEKSTENSKKVEKSSENKSNEAGDEARYSIVNVNASRKAVVIKDNILDGVNRNNYTKVVKETLKKFSAGLPVGNRLIKVNKITRDEYTNSKNAQYYRGVNQTIYADKMKASGHLDEIVLASDSYVNEGLKHTRNDNFKEFARGNVLLDIAGNQYAAKVIVGFTGSNMVLYDVVDFKPTKFTVTKSESIKKDTASGYEVAEKQLRATDNAVSSNTIIRENTEKSIENSKKVEKNIVEEKNAGEERFSIAQTDDGKRIVVIDTDQNIFDGVEAKDYPKSVRRYMLDKFQGNVYPVGTSSAYVNRNSIKEYTFSANRRVSQDARTKKMRAGTELDNLLEVAQFVKHEADDGRHPDAVRGWDKYKTCFTFDGKTIFEGEISIKLLERGDLFYDITKIKDTSTARTAGTADGSSSASNRDVSVNIIREKAEKSTENSKKVEKSSEVRYSLKPFAEQVDGALDKKLPKGDSVLVSEHTPEWIIKAGFDDFPMLITQKHLRDINTPEETVGKSNYHGISREKIKQLPVRLQNPVMLFDSLTDSRSIVVVTDMLDDKGRPVVAAVRADGSGMYLGVDIKSNFVTSFYGKDGFASFILKHINHEKLLYWNKEKSRKLYDTIRVQFPQALTTYDSDTIIRRSEAKVNSFDKNNSNERYSKKNIDNYTEKQYNDFGWSRVNEVLSASEYFNFNEKFGKSFMGTKFNWSSAREKIIPVHAMKGEKFGIENVLVFAKGTFQNPKIKKVIRIDSDNETELDIVRRKIYESKGVIDESYWDGLLKIYNASDFQRGEQREGSRPSSGAYQPLQDGKGNTGRDKGNIRYSKRLEQTENSDNAITLSSPTVAMGDKPGQYSEVLTKVKTEKLSYKDISKATWTNFQINFSDAQTGIVKAGKRLGIEDVEAKTNYVRAAYNAANSMLDENQADISGKRVGDGLKKIFAPAYKKGEEYVKEFYTYLLLKHHADRIKVDKTVLGDLTAAEALQLAVQREVKYPEFKTLAAKVWKYNDNLLQYRVDTGLITAEAAAACRRLYPHYVPTFREGSSSGIGGLSGKYNLAVKSTLKTAKGSTLDIMPIDVIMARQTMEVVRAGRINQLKNSLYDALERGQNYSDMRVAGVERVNKAPEKLRLTAPVKAELYNALDVDYSTMRDMNNQISFYKDGNRITLDVTPEVFAGFEDFAPNTAYRDKLIEAVAKGNALFKKLVTSANPFFLVRNFFRDLQDALFYTKHGIRRFLPSLAKAYKQIATKGEMWNEYLAAGGLSSGLFDYNTGIKRGETGLKGLAERALNKLEYANMFIEQAPRLAEYMLSRQKGLSVEQSLLDSADVTTNFGRGGKTAKMLNRTVMPFLNPSIQGWSKLVRTVFGKKSVSQWIQLVVRSLLLGIGLTALNDLLNGDDEDYEAVSLRDKENYYLFNIGGGQFLKLPKGRVLSVLGSLYLRGKESAKGNANAWDGYLESAASAVSPVDNFTRTIFSPLTDAATNTTWYGGVIEGRGLQNLSPENRYDESTSEIAKALGKALNYSPKKIHYIIDQYSGVIGDIVLPMTTAKSERGLVASNFTVNTAVSNRYSGEFYDKLDEITYAKNDGDRNAAFKYRYLNDVAGEVSDMYAKRREIEGSDLSSQDKSAQSEAVSVLISQTQKSAVKGLEVLDKILNSIDYDKRVAKLTQGFAYRQLTDDEKDNAAVKMYDYYYALAMNKAFGAELDRKQTIYNMINDDKIFIYLARISSLAADTDSNGNAINGSRKKKVETYVDGLPLSSLHKYLLMLLAGYKLGDIGKNKVAGYFNGAALDNSIRENLLSLVA